MEKVILGLVVFAITSVITYLFRMRQLYVAVAKLFRYSTVSKEGSLCEVIIFNRGNHPEESIQVVLDPQLKCEVLAASEGEFSLENSTIKIDRLHKGREFSAVLLVENGILDHSKIVSVSSKSVRGKVLKHALSVPPNFAKYALVITALLLPMPLLIYGERAVGAIQRHWTEGRLASLYKLGWSGLDEHYAGSALRKSYSDQEFPLRLVSSHADADEVALTYDVLNKTAIVLTVYAHPKGESLKYVLGGRFASAEVAPMSKGSILIKLPTVKSTSKPVPVEVDFKLGGEFIPVFHTPPNEGSTQFSLEK
jgi:hypothetical protein